MSLPPTIFRDNVRQVKIRLWVIKPRSNITTQIADTVHYQGSSPEIAARVNQMMIENPDWDRIEIKRKVRL